MKIKLLLLILVSSFSYSCAQSEFNMSFEDLDPDTGNPINWNLNFTSGGGYQLEIDSILANNGKYCLRITSGDAANSGTFAASSVVIPALYSGSKIKLEGYMRTQDVSIDGYGGLWLRIDGEGGMLAFNNMEDQKITGTTDWTKYSIELPLDEEARNINIGGLLVGNGRIWVDGLRLYIDNIDFQKAPPKEIKISKAQLDSAYYTGSEIDIADLNTLQVTHLSLLGKVWGFLKYYHPAVASGDHNWDFELFRIMPSVLESKTHGERDQFILDWISKFDPVAKCSNCQVEISEESNLQPDLTWITESGMSVDLVEKLQFILQNRNMDKHYYVASNKGVGNPVFKNENVYTAFEYPDAGYRILALYRYWNIIQYFFPYKYAIEEDWNGILDEFLPAFVEAKDALDYRLTSLRLINSVHDTHANIWGSDSILNKFKGEFYPPFQVKFVEEHAVVTGYYNESLGEESGLRKGDIIETIDGISVADIVKEKLDTHPASNYPTKLRDIAKSLLRGSSQSVRLSMKRADDVLESTITRYPSDSLDLNIDWAYNKPDSCYSWAADNIGYIYLGNIQANLLPRIFDEFEDAKGIVIDIRNYPSEFVVFSLGRYLMPAPTEFVKFSAVDLTYPGLFTYTPVLKVGESNEDYYKGKVVILVNEISQSQAEYTTMALRQAPNATVIGSTTAGADGNVSPFYFPGNLRTMISGIGVYYPDGKETQRIGIIADVEVKPTIQGIREDRDELLEKAIQLINTSN